MMKKNNIVAMIPARIGSTRLKMKNLSLIFNKPLIYYSINAAKKSNMFDKIVLNSDHEIFSKIAKRYNIDFYLRNKKLGNSKVKSDDVVFDFIKNYQSNICCWINPIAPLQSSEDIVRTIKYFKKNKLDSLITVENKMVHVNYNKKPINYNKKEKFQQTQDLESIDLFSYTIMMWKSKKFLSNMLKNKYAFCRPLLCPSRG